MMPGQRVHQVPKYVTAVEFESAPDRMRARGFKAEGSLLVGAIGFEPTTPCAQGRCATRLRYAPTRFIINEAPCATFQPPDGGSVEISSTPGYSATGEPFN